MKQQQTILYLIKWVTAHNDIWLISLTCLVTTNDWLWPDHLIDIRVLCLIFPNINNIQHQQLKLFIQKDEHSISKVFLFFLKIKKGWIVPVN